MANLETLELTISSNAESASKGLDKLINSLSALSKKVGSCVGGLKRLNAELAKMANYKATTVGIFDSSASSGVASAKSTSMIKRQTAAVKAWQERVKDLKPTISHFRDNLWDEEKQRQMNPEWFVTPGSKQWQETLLARNEALQKNGGALPIALDRSSLEQIDQVGQKAEETVSKVEKLKAAFSSFKGKVKDVAGKVKDFIPQFNLLNRMMRIASTMLMRMAFRALFSGIKEGLTNYYQYSKAIGGEFAKSMDNVSSSWKQLKNQMGASFASAISAAIPVINALANAAITAFNYVSQLIALLSGKNSWSKATSQVAEFGDAVNQANGGGGGGGMKELLANFDELNVIASESGGGGGGGAADTAEEFTDMFQEMYTFDSAIKDTIEWLENHLPVVNGLVAALAAHLLGLPGSIVIGIGLVATGISFDYNAGYDAGKNGFTLENIAEGIGGLLLTTLGSALIGFKIGGAYGAIAGAIIGIGISIVAYATGFNIGIKDSFYGDLTYSREQIDAAIKQYYHFKVNPEIDLMKSRISGIERLKTEAQEALRDLNVAQIVLMNSDFGEGDIEQFKQKVQNLVTKTQEMIQGNKEFMIELDIALNGEITAEGLQNTEGWNILSGVIGDLGTKIGDILSDNVIDEFESVTLENLTGSMSRISAAIITGERQSQYHTASFDIRDAFINGELSRESFTDYVLGLSGLHSDTMQTAKQAVDLKIDQLAQQVAGLEAAQAEGYETWNGVSVADALEAARAELESYTANNGQRRKDEIQALFEEWTGESIAMERSDLLAGYESLFTSNEGHLGKSISSYFYQHMRGASTAEQMAEMIDGVITSAIAEATGQDKKIILEAQELFDITGWDMLTDNFKQKIFNTFVEELKIDVETAFAVIKETYNLGIEDLVSVVDWDSLSDEQNIRYINALRNIFGDAEIKRFIEESGSDVAETFGDAFDSAIKTDTIKKLKKGLQEGYRDLFNSVNKDITLAGENISDIIDENWDFIAPMVDTYGLEQSIDFIAAIIAGAGDEAETNVRNWDLVAPMINAYGTEKSAELLNKALYYFGDNAEVILANWDLVSPGIDMNNLDDSLQDMEWFIAQTGVDIETIINNWHLIAPQVSGVDITTSIQSLKELARTTGVDMKTLINNWNLVAPSIDGRNIKSTALSLMKEVAGILSEKQYITVGLASDGSFITTNVQTTNGKSTISLSKSLYKASGAFGIPAGDVFIANEAGAELVGSINGKTSVANQEQIIAGIQRGVAEANSEQNTLLKEQNALLRSILQKDSSVRIGASAALGRVAKQSLEMYGSMVGG